MGYIYELFQAPRPEEEWTTEYDFDESPSALPIAERVVLAANRDAVIAHFGAWLEERRLGLWMGEMFLVNRQAADRYFEGRFTAFQQAMTALQTLNEAQFIHEHDQVQKLIDKLGQSFTQKYGDYVLWGDDMTPTPLEEFLRKAQPGQRYFFGAVFYYH